MVNAPGSGILETPALLGVPVEPMAKARDRPPACPADRRHLVVRPGDGARLCRSPIASGCSTGPRSRRARRRRAAAGRSIPSRTANRSPAARGDSASSARRTRALSTAPVFSEGVLEPRPVTLRVFLARDEEGWHVMPGRLCPRRRLPRGARHLHAEAAAARSTSGSRPTARRGRSRSSAPAGSVFCGSCRAPCPPARPTISTGSDATPSAARSRPGS